jgi:hypothetical protein
MKTLTFLLLITFLTLFFFSCKKDDPVLTRTDLLTLKSWKRTAVKVSGTDSQQDECSANDIYTFFKDASYSLDEGATKCLPDDDQVISGNWNFVDSESKIRISFSGISLFNKEIIELTPSVLKVKFNFIVDFEETYTH